MYPLLHQLLSDKKGGTDFTCFGLWHFLYLALFLAVIAGLLLWLRGKSAETRRQVADGAILFSFCLYIADFFLMPFAYGAIDLEKLPFHACTATCVLCFIASRQPRMEKLRLPLTLLALASNLIYVIYPAGVGWQQIHPLSYRVMQTLLYHGSMTAYGVLYLASREARLTWKACCRTLPVIIAMTLWAMLGNALYNGTADGYDHFFNWFFVVRDPFYLLPADIAPYIMPFVMVLVMFTAVTLIYGASQVIRKLVHQ